MKFDKFTDVCMTGGIRHTPSHTNVCKFVFNLFEFSPDILEKGLLCVVCNQKKGQRVPASLPIKG